MQETLYRVPKLGKKCLAHVFKCSPSWGLIPRNTHQGETRPGLWSPEAGFDYPPVLSLQSTLRMSILRTVMIFTGCLAGRSIYSQEQNELTIPPSMWITAGEKELNTTLLLSEMLQQCQRAQDFLHVRHDSRPLYFCKCHILCQGCPLLPLSAWPIFLLYFKCQFWCRCLQEAFPDSSSLSKVSQPWHY